MKVVIIKYKPKSEAEGANALLLIGTKENSTCVQRHGSKSSGWMLAGAGLEPAQLLSENIKIKIF